MVELTRPINNATTPTPKRVVRSATSRTQVPLSPPIVPPSATRVSAHQSASKKSKGLSSAFGIAR